MRSLLKKEDSADDTTSTTARLCPSTPIQNDNRAHTHTPVGLFTNVESCERCPYRFRTATRAADLDVIRRVVISQRVA